MDVLREEFIVDVLRWGGSKRYDSSNEIDVELSITQ